MLVLSGIATMDYRDYRGSNQANETASALKARVLRANSTVTIFCKYSLTFACRTLHKARRDSNESKLGLKATVTFAIQLSTSKITSINFLIFTVHLFHF